MVHEEIDPDTNADRASWWCPEDDWSEEQVRAALARYRGGPDHG